MLPKITLATCVPCSDAASFRHHPEQRFDPSQLCADSTGVQVHRPSSKAMQTPGSPFLTRRFQTDTMGLLDRRLHRSLSAMPFG